MNLRLIYHNQLQYSISKKLSLNAIFHDKRLESSDRSTKFMDRL
jgi:hypothetical protein